MADDPDVHHIKGVLKAATGSKVSDLFTIGLDHEIHMDFHSSGKKDWESRYGESQAENCILLINKALEQGLISIVWNGEQ